MKYLINPLRTKRKAHLWNGSDTACRMGSTGGLRMSEYAVVEDKEGRQVCSICEQISAAQAKSSGEGPLPDSLWRAAMSVYHREIRRNPGNAWQAVCTEVLRLGGCARDQGTTQYCAEAARLAAELHIATEWSARVHAGQQEDADTITALRAEVERLKAALERIIAEYPEGFDCHKYARAALKETRT